MDRIRQRARGSKGEHAIKFTEMRAGLDRLVRLGRAPHFDPEGFRRALLSVTGGRDPGDVLSRLLAEWTGLVWSSDEARRRWREIEKLYLSMHERLREPLGLQTALLHYLHDRRELLTRPHLLSEREWKTLRAHAITDPLTGLFNRRFLADMLSRQIGRASHSGETLSIVMMDLEGFKSINDRLGHLAGDRVLVRTAAVIRDSLRPGDFACRWGGDEFVAVLPQVDLLGSLAVAERIRKNTSESSLPPRRGLKLGLYYGASSFPYDGKSIDELIHSADHRLYQFREQWHYGRGNRRQYPRFEPDWLHVRLRVGRDGAPRETSVVDVGYGGLAFEAEGEEELPTDGTAEIGRDESNRRSVRLRIANEARLPDGGVRVGCSYA